jgi:hypothetical protein
MKKPAHPAIKKPVSRATLLEGLVSDFLEVEDIFLKLEFEGDTRPLTTKETRLYKDLRDRLRQFVAELTNDLAREHRAA